MDRRAFITASTGMLAALAGCNQSLEETPTTTSPTDSSSPSNRAADTETGTADVPEAVGLGTVVTGLERPVDIAFVPDSDRRYVAGIALHPAFPENRRLFVRYSAPARADTPEGDSHTFVLSEFRVDDDGYEVIADSEREILTIPQPQANHNAGSVLFGPDGYLYIGVGDGGAGGDQGKGHVQDWYDAVDGGNGQDVTENLLDSILRIDVDDQQGDQAYAIPDSNPLVGAPGLDEQFAWGFRNPWRLSFDGDKLYAGDVGQNRYEEVDRVKKGGNYGWNVMEGTHCFQADDCPDERYPDVRGGEPLLDPVTEYPHGNVPVSGISVIVGNVYRGSAVPGLHGQFVFGDLQAGGELFVAQPAADGLWETEVLPVESADAEKMQQIYSVHRHAGEIVDSLPRRGFVHVLFDDDEVREVLFENFPTLHCKRWRTVIFLDSNRFISRRAETRVLQRLRHDTTGRLRE
ncbi:MAG: PQQ-dependent sugar dehydrogenase [Halolamina sp.]